MDVEAAGERFSASQGNQLEAAATAGHLMVGVHSICPFGRADDERS